MLKTGAILCCSSFFSFTFAINKIKKTINKKKLIIMIQIVTKSDFKEIGTINSKEFAGYHDTVQEYIDELDECNISLADSIKIVKDGKIIAFFLVADYTMDDENRWCFFCNCNKHSRIS